MTDMLDVVENGESATIPAPRVCIVLLTYLRTEMALRTIKGVYDNLDYPNRVWYIADDGSPSEHIQALLAALEHLGEKLYTYHNQVFATRPFCGTGWNVALQKAHAVADYVLWLEDDWVLGRKFDLRPYVRLMLEREDVGIVSMRGLSTGLHTEVMGHNGIHYLRILRKGGQHSMAYSGNPLLRHKRYMEQYGLFPENHSPGDLEIVCDNAYRANINGCDIWRPVDIGGWGDWGHIGNERTW